MPSSPPVARPKVLVVDDDRDARALAGVQLGDRFEVFQAESGPHCLEIAPSLQPDVILLDMMMPGMSGQDVLNALSGHPATHEIPVVFLSALTSAESVAASIEHGAVDYIAKPHDPRELAARVAAAARSSSRNKGGEDFDATTQLPRRRAFEARLGHEVIRSERSDSPLSIMLVDLDGFGEINARFGTETGDSLLKEVGMTMRHNLRASDGVYRYGSDEFAAILCDTDVATAFVAAERCRGGISKITWDGHPTHVSIGTAEFSSGRGPEEIVARAEIALFRAQESGGNRCWRADDPRRHGLNPIALSQGLTDREWDLLAHLANRRSESEIARRMGIRTGTVRSHKARIRRKLNVRPEVKLTDFALSNFGDLVDRLGRLEVAEGAAG